MSSRPAVRRIRRITALLLLTTLAVGAAILAPDRTPARIDASHSAISQDGLADPDYDIDDNLRGIAGLSPREVAKQWASATAAEKTANAAALPLSVGNLNGIPYKLRDSLNRRALLVRIKKVRDRLRSFPEDEAAKTSLSAYQAITKALKPTKPRRMLIELTGDVMPLAAISVGNLDTARQATWLVPGMGTYSTDMPLWSLAAQNLYDAQGSVGAPKRRTVVAWMGYVPPPPPPSIEASRGDYAEQGAPHLIRDLEGFRAARSADIGDIRVNVVAHSYGTTVTADALANEPLDIDSVVMLGSAGIENTVGSAGALHAREVYAAESTKDPQAVLGRFSRFDPRSPAFGAAVFSVEGDQEHSLTGVTGHAPILHSAWNDDVSSSLWQKITDISERIDRFLEHKAAFGYLDRGTESLANTASATTAHPTRAVSVPSAPSRKPSRPKAE
ncbi:alpha/beta hydrolase [Leifsonia sp. 2MCAF36]|uniref:alpha/beta hydrolase n=1 Tax=Leifsonia sp. 2MCAF36 TaxID=3232988 RepID=UPI003F9BEDD3